MIQPVRISPRRARDPDEAERRALMSSLSRTRAQINQAYGCFNQTSDGDLIESYVFEINALQARYNYLLRRLKQLGAQPGPALAPPPCGAPRSWGCAHCCVSGDWWGG